MINYTDKSNPTIPTDFSTEDYVSKINALLNSKDQNELTKFTKNLHNADIADIIQNLDEDNRSKFIFNIKDFFDPEILTYLSEGLKEEVIDKLDIEKLASNVSELDTDDAVDGCRRS